MSVDPEETREERATRVINKASGPLHERAIMFNTTLRNNVRDLTPHGREVLSTWLRRMFDQFQATLDDGDGLPPLGLDSLDVD